jgi:hypothetical protein
MQKEWHWEGNVVKAIAVYLQTEGWNVQHTADTESRESGVDIRAQKEGKTLLVEVKGYPSKVYQRGVNQGQPKRTNPPTQARHWYGEVLLLAILRQEQFPEATVAIAFPKFPVYANFIRRTRHALFKLDIDVLIVDEFGTVSTIRQGVES